MMKESKLTSVDMGVVHGITATFQRLYERQKEFLSYNSSQPNERNAYYSLSNAIARFAGRRNPLAATEVSLDAKRRIDAAFILGPTLYLIELKTTTARVKSKDVKIRKGNPDKRKFSKSTRLPLIVAKQLDSITIKASLIENLMTGVAGKKGKIKRVVLVGLAVGNLRVSDTDVGAIKHGVTGKVVRGFGQDWIENSIKPVIDRGFVVVSRNVKLSPSKKRETRSARIQNELGLCIISFVKVL